MESIGYSILGGFNPPSPCGEGHTSYLDQYQASLVSIHPPRVGRDIEYIVVHYDAGTFQSTLPVWGGTRSGVRL